MADPDFVLVTTLPAPPSAVFAAWTDGEQHAAFTGAAATSEPREFGEFTAWDGYIQGDYLTLVPAQRISMHWRTTQFPDDADDAHVLVDLEPCDEGTRLTLTQSGTPDGQADSYREGWETFYFAPMRAWLAKQP